MRDWRAYVRSRLGATSFYERARRAYAVNSQTCPAGAGFSWGGNTILNSFHTGGLNVLMTDGSVRLLTETVDFNAFQRACARNDGQVNNLP